MNNPAKIEEILANTPVCLPEWPVLTMEEIREGLIHAEKILILTHVNPDGDCIGSAFALKESLCAMGKSAWVLSPSELPKRLRFLCGDQQSLAPGSADPDTFDLILSIDVASPIQLGELAVLIPKIDWMIDHHGMGEAYARNYIDPTASAAGEIVCTIYRELQKNGAVGKCPEAARKMYAAIVSDTIGYIIHPHFRHRGYMTQALRLAISELFSIGYREILTGAFACNTASIRVMEKCRMEHLQRSETIEYRGRVHECIYYAIRNREEAPC